jgi:DNA topoisomerase-3
MRLIVAEKSSQGKEIAHALGIPYLTSENFPAGTSAAVVALAGHTLELAAPEGYDPKLKQWSLSSLPILPGTFKRLVSNNNSKARAYGLVAKLVKSAQVTDLVNACDPDREGELIFCEVLDQVNSKKPFQRLWVKDLTENGIKAAYGSLRPGAKCKPIQDAAKCRQEADWLVGMNLTRAQTKLAGSKGRDGVWSIGRCQTPTLSMVVDREREIQAFKPKPFWTLHASFSCGAGKYQGTWFRPAKDGQEEVRRFLDGTEAQQVADRVKGKPGKIVLVDQHDERSASELFYDIGAIRGACNKRFGFSGDKTNDLLQSLYLKKVMTYPRTDYRCLTEEEGKKLPATLQAMKAWPEFAAIVAEMEQKGYLAMKLGKPYVDNAKVGEHSALCPTGEKASLSEDEMKVYDLIVRRVLAAFFPKKVTARTVILTEVEGEMFQTKGAVVKEEGWYRIDPSRKSPAKGKAKPEDGEGDEGGEDDDSRLPPVSQGMAVTTEDLKVNQDLTKPPKRLTEADLEKLMQTAGRFVEEEELQDILEECGIGTGATRADIIKTLIDREYLERSKKVLLPTQKAFELMDDIPDPSLKSPSMTAEWERRLAKMEKGEDSRTDFMAGIGTLIGRYVAAYQGRVSPEVLEQEKQAADRPVLADCPKCKKGKLLRYVRSAEKGGGFFAKCDRKACGVFAGVDAAGNLVIREAPCRFCGERAVTSSKFGDTCIACGKAQGELAPVNCDKCGSEMTGRIYEGKPYVKCMDQKNTGCKRSWYTTDTTYSVRQEVQVATPCCTCGSAMVAKHSKLTGPYVQCSVAECKTWWPTDGSYQTPTLGVCKACGGPLRSTRENGPVCAKCGTFVEKHSRPSGQK